MWEHQKYFLIQTAREISLTNGYNISNNDILIEISKQWGAETKDNFDKINDIDFRAIFRYKMYQKYNKSEITGSAANVRSLYALFGGYSHNSEVFEWA